MNPAASLFMAALTAWRENRGGGNIGMQSVINVIQNRAKKRGTDFYLECIKPLQFSSISYKTDPQLATWPLEGDPQFAVALDMASEALQNALPDLTSGATLYYSLSMEQPPGWAARVTETVRLQGQVFFKETA